MTIFYFYKKNFNMIKGQALVCKTRKSKFCYNLEYHTFTVVLLPKYNTTLKTMLSATHTDYDHYKQNDTNTKFTAS